MTESRRPAPDPEFVRLYRAGTPTSKIADWAGVATTTVRYHLQIAAKEDPGIRDEHRAASSPAPRTSTAGRRNLADVLAFYETHGRLPGTHGKTPRERALAAWLGRRRRQAAEGTLSPAFRDGLAVIPGWGQTSRSKTDDEARWQQRLDELQRTRAAGGDWPRHQKTDDRDERTLGVWLHGQRIDYRAGKLDPDREEKLNELLPGWREGRGRRNRRRTPNPPI
ncbi:helicase associated domain-containing protein [Arthrobacter sp. AK04]|uniref:helicase associated domain-containing protein n=1 Tax=Arthrobacter sp. AK04 TaxID=2900048 RepID=UPI001E506168|nr:helicase associated domain-containing protein [Arthrobacter sp. AK04]MCD5342803.1 helicase associated domain-containing protein [Arthrobacter sp. AK04]